MGDVIADGLLKEVLDYNFQAFTAVLRDVLSVAGQFSKQLQAESLNLSELMPLGESALGHQNGLKEVKAQCETEFNSHIITNRSKIYMYYIGIPLTHTNEKSQIKKLKVSYTDGV